MLFRIIDVETVAVEIDGITEDGRSELEDVSIKLRNLVYLTLCQCWFPSFAFAISADDINVMASVILSTWINFLLFIFNEENVAAQDTDTPTRVEAIPDMDGEYAETNLGDANVADADSSVGKWRKQGGEDSRTYQAPVVTTPSARNRHGAGGGGDGGQICVNY